jgi:hypothetical protein
MASQTRTAKVALVTSPANSAKTSSPASIICGVTSIWGHGSEESEIALDDPPPWPGRLGIVSPACFVMVIMLKISQAGERYFWGEFGATTVEQHAISDSACGEQQLLTVS